MHRNYPFSIVSCVVVCAYADKNTWMVGWMGGWMDTVRKSAFLPFLLIPVSFEAIARGVPCDLGTKFGLKN